MKIGEGQCHEKSFMYSNYLLLALELVLANFGEFQF